jgi:hypothetical protein
MFRKHLLQLSSIENLDKARHALLPLRSIVIDGFTLKESRILWYAWILYKFKSEQTMPEPLWISARSVILEAMRGNEITEVSKDYFKQFAEWTRDDLYSLVDEMARYYFHTLELKQLIETHSEETKVEWRESYTHLLNHIQTSAEKLCCWNSVQQRVEEMAAEKRGMVYHMLHKVFWDRIEEDIRKEEYSTIFCQLMELKQLMKEIVPGSFYRDLEEHLDMDFIRQRLESKTFDNTFVLSLSKWVMESLQEWDSEHVHHLYDKEINALYQCVEVMEFPVLVRTVLEICTMLALDLKTRKGIWMTTLGKDSSSTL